MAGDLKVGDEIYSLDGTAGGVTGILLEWFVEPVKVYNLEVEGYHSYFVGDIGLLVHNACKRDLQQVEDAARKTGLDEDERRIFGDYIEDLKKQSGKRNDTNFSFQELMNYAKEVKSWRD
ncbi:hypothetical protein AGMMS49975_21960 [Clostridia bacterium]|nr:hypothetical protein AGMMS49975_21960 [Clostridia bacterium]